jgi:hypothetical protein
VYNVSIFRYQFCTLIKYHTNCLFIIKLYKFSNYFFFLDPPQTIQLDGHRSALISQANALLKFSCGSGPSNPASEISISIDDKPLEINFKQTEMHYSIDHNSIKTSNSLNLEHLLLTFDLLNRKLNGFINFANSSTNLNKLFNDKQSMQRKRKLKIGCTASHPLLINPLTTEYDLQLLCKCSFYLFKSKKTLFFRIIWISSKRTHLNENVIKS